MVAVVEVAGDKRCTRAARNQVGSNRTLEGGRQQNLVAGVHR